MLDSPNRFLHKVTTLEGRTFSLQILKFANGYFVSISEGDDKMGSLVISVASTTPPATTTIIPTNSGSFFLRLVAEQISSRVKGIALVSSFVKQELKQETAKGLMTEIMDMIQDE